MRPVSTRTAARKRKQKALKAALIEEVEHCENCRCDLSRVPIRFIELHHIIRQLRPNERCAVLLLCWKCHMLKIHSNDKDEHWPEARQLVLLLRSRPKDFNLREFNRLKGRGPDRLTIEDMEKWNGTQGA